MPRTGATTAALPTGTVTFVLADVERSVRLWQWQPDAMAQATARFDVLVSRLVAEHAGVRPAEQGEGDSFVAGFRVARDAVTFALAVQRVLRREPWAADLGFRVRMAIHTGTAQLRGTDNYMGHTVNRCARLRGLAHGGQVLVCGVTEGLVADELGDGAALLDLGVHPLRDFDRPEHVFQLVHPDLPERSPPIRDAGTIPPLPVLLTSFVARDDELAYLSRLLEGERLVTLTGAGGSGKTRLALEAARRSGSRFGDGVAWADAAPITDGALLASCIAAGLGIRETPTEPLIETIVREIGERHVLLVVDNCEHVLDEAAQLAEALLARCPRIQLLTTSREPVGVSGEVSLRVPSLDAADAIELFIDRARASDPGFPATDDARDPIAEICRRLDGIPLAIELAAARVRVLSPQQIAEGLADRFRLLTGGSRTAMPRQRTLEASVDWSYRLLAEPERLLLDRLSVFAGGFTMEAVTRVCPDDALPEAGILDGLAALVDKSLLQVEVPNGGGEARYRMLETIRHFARQRLADSSDPEAPRNRHLRYFLEVVEEAGPEIERAHELAALARLEADTDNIRAALDWADQRGEAELLLRMMAALWLFFEVSCRFDEGRAWLSRAIAGSPEPTATRARALHGLGDLSIFTLDMATVAAAGEEVLAIGDHLDDAAIRARGIVTLAWAASMGAYRDATWAVDAVTAMLSGLDDTEHPWLYADASTAIALCHITEGNLREARVAADQAIASARRSGMLGPLQRALYFRGWVDVFLGDVVAGEEHLNRVVEIADELDDTFFRALALAGKSFGHLLAGDLDPAESEAAEAAALGARYGNPFGLALGGLTRALALAFRGADAAALALVESARPIIEDLSALWWLDAWQDGVRALAAARRGDGDSARSILSDAAGKLGARPHAAMWVLLFRAWVEGILGDEGGSEASFTGALEAAASVGACAEVVTALDGLAVGAARRDQPERAARLAGAAQAISEERGLVPMRPVGTDRTGEAEDRARRALGDGAYEAELGAGRGMNLEEAVRFALRGKGGRRRPTTGWESLTPTEVEVVRFVAQGFSNPAIAEKLLVTRGTVKVHLSHVFTKLGVQSRAELAAEATRRERG